MATRKKSPMASSDDPNSATDSADADSVEEQPRNHLRGPEGLSPLKVPPASTSSADLENVRVWPLCFAIAIEKSRRVRPAIMVGASSLLAGVTYHLQESDAELLVRVCGRSCSFITFSLFQEVFELQRSDILFLLPFFFHMSTTARRIGLISAGGFRPY